MVKNLLNLVDVVLIYSVICSIADMMQPLFSLYLFFNLVIIHIFAIINYQLECLHVPARHTTSYKMKRYY